MASSALIVTPPLPIHPPLSPTPSPTILLTLTPSFLYPPSDLILSHTLLPLPLPRCLLLPLSFSAPTYTFASAPQLVWRPLCRTRGLHTAASYHIPPLAGPYLPS